MTALDSTASNVATMEASDVTKPRSLFAASTAVTCFFRYVNVYYLNERVVNHVHIRRPCFTPDGSLLLAPAGIMKPEKAEGNSPSPGRFCTHVFHRSDLSTPVLSLAGLEEPSVVVRCCPRVFKPVEHAEGMTPQGFHSSYRMIFAVATTSSVLVYDTQHIACPVLRINNLHFATINDMSWSADGFVLFVCSTDGYVSIIRFAEDAFGRQMNEMDTPVQVKKTYPFIYGYKKVETGAMAAASQGATVELSTKEGAPPLSVVPTTSSVLKKEINSSKKRIAPTLVKPLANITNEVMVADVEGSSMVATAPL